ncbi:MAG: DUF362 domain-containing protein [Acidobacteriaceae bacterium]|nr:DUF362 domain-containing protein [Acidobacteriaceae bacterium]
MSNDLNRRLFGAALLAGTGALAFKTMRVPAFLRDRRKARSRVAILNADTYATPALEMLVSDGLQLFALDLKGKNVLLKPNLVEYIPGAEVNTNSLLVGAAADAFLKLGAKSVVVAEGPGHERDTYLVVAQNGLEAQLRNRSIRFVDLNRDEVVQVPLKNALTGLDSLWLPRTVLAADIIVSMPKVKTHHWAGVTLSVKNMFGVIPGAVYGWPKNVLHWQGIDRSILDIASTVPIHFVIADGIVGMEGNGPLHGQPRHLGRIIMSDDPVAADFTCAHLMGLNPWRVTHLAQAASFLGNGDAKRIEQLAEGLPLRVRPFSVLPEFAHLLGERV